MSSCCSWQSGIIDMDLHGGLLHSSAQLLLSCNCDCQVSPSVYQEVYSLKTAASACSMTTRSVSVLPELSAKHFAEFPFWLLLCNLFCGLSQLCKVSYFFGCWCPERE